MTLEELFANSQQNQATPEVAPAQSQNFISKVLGVLRPNLGSPGSFDRLKMQDLVPNIFGVNDPNVEGLLGADQSKSLQSRSNIAGLLGAAAALSQGMSRGGPRRSALQNILGAAAGGYGAAGQQYQQGLQTVGQQQQLAQQMRERDKARLIQQDIERVMQMPEVANNAPLMAALRADPIPALKFINENMPISRAYEQIPTALVQQPGQIADPVFAAGQAANNQLANGAEDPSLAPVVSRNANPEEQIKRLLLANERLTPLSTKAAREAIESNIKQIELIRKNIATEGLMNFNFSKAREGIPPQSLPAFDLIQQSVEQGIVDPKDLPKMLQDLSQKPGDVQSYLYAKTEGYQGNFEKWKQGPGKVASDGTIVNLGDKKFTEQFATSVAKAVERTHDNALSAQNTISTIQTIRPLIQEGVYAGPISSSRLFIDRLASSLGFASGSVEEKLARTSQAMQGLASLQLDGAKAMAGQGTITDFERGLIDRASAGNFAQFTAKEVVSLMNALEKVANKKIATHKTNLTRLRKRKDTADLADYYELDDAPDSQSVRQYNPATGRIE